MNFMATRDFPKSSQSAFSIRLICKEVDFERNGDTRNSHVETSAPQYRGWQAVKVALNFVRQAVDKLCTGQGV